MDRQPLIDAFSSARPGSMLFVKGYRPTSSSASAVGACIDYWVNAGINWARTLERSAEVLDTFTIERIAADCPTCLAQGSRLDALDLAAQALSGPKGVRQSLNKAMAGNTRPARYRSLAPGLYVKVDATASDLTEPLYLRGLLQGNYVQEQGDRRVVRSNDLTLTKRWIERSLPRSRYITLKLEAGVFSRLSVNRQRFTPADLFISADRLEA
jgi:hypothetical protein|tara:strand:+ start:2748 stop:3383 length:636 start_codon:yes stop_codon:yes gene_type:complete